MVSVINPPKQDSKPATCTQQSQHHETGFIKWCREFNVGLLANKNSEFTVKIGDHVKHVKLERI